MNLNASFKNTKLPRLSYGERLRPVRDWFALLGAAAALLVVSALFNVYLFSRAVGGAPVGAPVAQELSANASLERVEQIFNDRDAEEQRYRGEYRFVDPSR